MRRLQLFVFISLALLGMAIILWANLGDAAVTASTAGIYGALEHHGQGGNPALRDELYTVVFHLRWPWSVARWLGFGVAVLAGLGFTLAWKAQ